MRSAPAISFELRRSRQLIAATITMAGLAVLSIAISAVAFWLKIVLMAGVVLATGRAVQHLIAPRWRRISHGQGGWQVQDVNGETRVADLHHHARLGNLIVLDFRRDGVRWNCLIAADAIDADTRRRLLLTLAALRPVDTPRSIDPS